MARGSASIRWPQEDASGQFADSGNVSQLAGWTESVEW